MITSNFHKNNAHFNTIISNIGHNFNIEGDSSDLEHFINTIPKTIPILPVRGMVVYPLTAVPLTVGQTRSINLIEDATSTDKIIGLVTSKNSKLENPDPDQLFDIGTAAIVHKLMKTPDGTIRLLVQGIARIKITDYAETEPYLKANVNLHPETNETGIKIEALVRTTSNQFEKLAHLIPSIPDEMIPTALNVANPKQLAYAVATYLRIDLEVAQQLLETNKVSTKLKKILTILGREIEVLELGYKLQKDAHTVMEGTQREYFLREQLKAIQRELGEDDEQSIELNEFDKKINESKLPAEAEKEARRELARLSKLPAASAEYGVIRTYLDTITSLPWNNLSPNVLNIKSARQALDEDHHGLDKVKERILEFLSVRKLRLERKHNRINKTNKNQNIREGMILCLVGPPGVGKTSLGQSIARAMSRNFLRMSLGGIRDEAEIRGHRRTYIGAMPGRIMQSIRRCGTKNPVFMLDEIDKIGTDFRGDPASALLELLDPEQNKAFRDHYIDVDFDLSQVFFITTANTLEPIPSPLRDRMEILQMSGYTENEKLNIALDYLIPRQITEHGLRQREIKFKPDAIIEVIRHYTRESGVRNLERKIGRICRKVATGITDNTFKQATINVKRLIDFLGQPEHFFIDEVTKRTAVPGVATGVAWTPFGGDVLFIEATKMPGEKGFQMTGQLGDVMQESAKAALSFVRANSDILGLPQNHYQTHDIHLHVPSGSIPKDGPSAGVTIATAFASLFSHQPVKPEVGMTGEITLQGQVLPVGGIKEKVIAAHRAGLSTLVLPKRNEKDLDDIPTETRQQLKFVLVDRVEEVFAEALLQTNTNINTNNSTNQNLDS